VFTSNPLRGLDWLLDLWVNHVWPALPEAELHIYAGPAVYGSSGGKHTRDMEAVLTRADRLAGKGVWRHAPVGREALAEILGSARIMLYRGNPGETFCLSLAEAQAMGVPAVVQPIGAVGERVIDGATGCVAINDAAFAEAAVALLREDELWRQYHRNALASQRGLAWDEVAAQFEGLL
jgi:glycosyltransferase involved in cell wall biosynthesis